MTGTHPVPDGAPLHDDGMPNAPSSTDDRVAEMSRLRALLLGPERSRLDEHEARFEAQVLTPEQLAEQLPEAIAMRARQDTQLGIALAPTVERAISESVRRRPGEFADAIFPVLGPAIRKAIAETMADLVASINRAMEHSFSPRGIRWRVEAIRSGVPFAQVVLRHALVYRVEQVFLVHKETGLLLAKAAPSDLAVPDADLVSGMLTAIRDFVGDSFTEDAAAGGLRAFRVGELTVMVEPGPHAMLAAVVRGEPAPEFHERVQATIEGVHAQFASALVDFDGDDTAFAPAQPLLDDLIVTVLDTDTPAGKAVDWRPVVVTLVLLVALLGALAVRASTRWDRVIGTLEAAPGFTVVRAERGWWQSEIRGLRDPDAEPANAIIAAAGGDTSRIVQRWEPYQSLAPAFVLARAARAVSGPADIEQLVREVRASRVLFEIGSAVPGAPGSAQIDAIAARLAALHARVSALGGEVEVALTGRADGTGTDATNAMLSQQRVDVVRATLDSAVSGVRFSARALGASAPVDDPDPATRARVNRSVSFDVHLLLPPPIRTLRE